MNFILFYAIHFHVNSENHDISDNLFAWGGCCFSVTQNFAINHVGVLLYYQKCTSMTVIWCPIPRPILAGLTSCEKSNFIKKMLTSCKWNIWHLISWWSAYRYVDICQGLLLCRGVPKPSMFTKTCGDCRCGHLCRPSAKIEKSRFLEHRSQTF